MSHMEPGVQECVQWSLTNSMVYVDCIHNDFKGTDETTNHNFSNPAIAF